MCGFDVALLAIKAGKTVRRSSWKQGVYYNAKYDKIGCDSVEWTFFTWEPTHADLLAEDWIVEGDEL